MAPIKSKRQKANARKKSRAKHGVKPKDRQKQGATAKQPVPMSARQVERLRKEQDLRNTLERYRALGEGDEK